MIDEEEFISLEEKIDLMNCKSFRARRQFLKKIRKKREVKKDA